MNYTHIARWRHTKFLVLGEWEEAWKPFVALGGWQGTVVASYDRRQVPPGVIWLDARLHQDPHFVQTMLGPWVKGVTVEEVFRQFPGPYSVIAIDVPMKTRQSWFDKSIQAAGPNLYLLPEDGHNEEVILAAQPRGYTARVDDGVLALVRSE